MVGFAHAFESVFSLPFHWHVCGFILVVILLFLDHQSRRGGFLVILLWNLLGVLLHELAHFLIGTLLLARPTAFSLIPRRHEGGVQLGSVSFKELNAFNSLPVGLAPLGLIVLAFHVFQHWPEWFVPSFFSTVGMYFVSFILVYNSLPSRQDLKIAFGWKSILLYGTVAIVGWYAIGNGLI